MRHSGGRQIVVPPEAIAGLQRVHSNFTKVPKCDLLQAAALRYRQTVIVKNDYHLSEQI